MKDYLLEILKEKKRVIIPNLGAFISKEDQGKKIVFNEFLKYNDGVLIKHVADVEKISEQDAERKVMNFSKRVLADLNTGKEVDFGEIGMLNKDKSGKIKLDAQSEKPVTPADTKVKSESEKKVTEQKKVTEEKVKEKKIDEKPTSQTAPPVGTAKTTTQKETIKREEEKKEDPKLKSYSSHSTITSIPRQSRKKKKSNKNVVWVAMIIVVFLAIASWLIFFSPEFVKDWFGGDEVVEEPAMVPVVDTTAAIDSSALKEQVEVPEPTHVEEPDDKYYIIAGCFQYENNADNYVETLRELGYESEKVGKYNSLHAVSFASYGSMEEAKEALIKIRRNQQPRAWILLPK